MAKCSGLLLSLLLLALLSVISSAPVKVRFEGCRPEVSYMGRTWHCCPPLPKKPIREFKPDFDSSKPLRVRRALQCLDEEEAAVYKEKLEKAYTLLAALPKDDLRTMENQAILHCAAGTSALQNAGGLLNIHAGWLSKPWHRWFVYFHERILQSVLGDPTFTLHYWNWDNDGAAADVRSKACSKAGNKFPAVYADPSSPLYRSRSWRASVSSLPVDLNLMRVKNPTAEDPQLSDDVVLATNCKVMHDGMNPATNEDFYGKPFRAGDNSMTFRGDESGSMEPAHASIHRWVHGDMYWVPISSTDPVFWAHHANVERLWNSWEQMGPNRVPPEDSDFLDAEFLFYDENGDVVSVKVRDVLDTQALGYVDEEVEGASWTYSVDTSAQKIFPVTAQ
ncbi:hypothetical protein R1flu_024907 [Riccia fluitans]|uniref:Tyrosinase copper-binding domain-containing protein n=1 Tax=Riccia fluitans TaxID=41844 RepID=A0ABD1XW85_9MARC